MAAEIARLNGVPVIFYELEMAKHTLYNKLFSRLSGIPYPTLVRASYTKEQYEQFEIALKEFSEYAHLVHVISSTQTGQLSLSKVQV